MKKIAMLGAALAGLLLTGAGCGNDPCLELAPPSAQELAASNSGAQVEREVGSYECDLINDLWVLESD